MSANVEVLTPNMLFLCHRIGSCGQKCVPNFKFQLKTISDTTNLLLKCHLYMKLKLCLPFTRAAKIGMKFTSGSRSIMLYTCSPVESATCQCMKEKDTKNNVENINDKTKKLNLYKRIIFLFFY